MGARLKILLALAATVLLFSGCSGSGGGGGTAELTAEDKQAFEQGFSQTFQGFNSGLAQGNGTYYFDTGWNINPLGCITVVVSGTNFSVTFNNCDFSGYLISGTVTMTFSDLGGGAFGLTMTTNLVMGGLYTGSIGMNITMSFDGSSYAFSGQVTINGTAYSIDQFAGELPS